MTTQTMTLDTYVAEVMRGAKTRTVEHANRLSDAVLHVLGFYLSGGVKRKLARALPDPLARELTRGWRLLNVRDHKAPLHKFLKDVGLHSGNTDPQYAEMATAAVFRNLKLYIDDDLTGAIAKDLSPEVRKLWETA